MGDEVAKLRRQLAERDAALRELRAIIRRALPDSTHRRYDDPDDVMREMLNAKAGDQNGRRGCLADAHRSNAAFGDDWKLEREAPAEWRRKWGRLAVQQESDFRSRQETPDA